MSFPSPVSRSLFHSAVYAYGAAPPEVLIRPTRSWLPSWIGGRAKPYVSTGAGGGGALGAEGEPDAPGVADHVVTPSGAGCGAAFSGFSVTSQMEMMGNILENRAYMRANPATAPTVMVHSIQVG